MGVFAKGPKKEEREGGSSGEEVDLEVKACPVCRRELHPWEATCPDDGAAAVDRTSLTNTDLPPPPAHLLDDEDD
jgi:hypothetical protein